MTRKQRKIGILALFIILAGFFSCAKMQKKDISTPKLSRDYRIDQDSRNGLIYGKIIHNKSFGKKFTIHFNNLKTNSTFEISIESFSSDTADNLFLEFEPGEWLVDRIATENGEKVKVSDLRQDEHKEFIVERGDISYIGTWIINPGEFKVLNHKQDQDQYMRMNYKNVMTASALVSLP